MNLSVKHLRAFMALREHKHFTRAAQACHLSQPAFSALIRSLEQDAGARLFERSTRRVELTPEGEVFAESAAHLLASFEHAYGALQDRVHKRKGAVAIAALPSIAAGLLPAVLGRFRRAYPGIDITLFDVLSDSCSELVRSGRADFALAGLADDMTELRATPLCTDDFHLVCPRGHPLAGKTKLRARDLLPYPFIHLARNTSIRQHLDAILHPLRLHGVMEVEQLATAVALVASGLGITVVPSLTLFQFHLSGLVVVPLPLPRLVRRLYVIQPRHRSLSVAAAELLSMLMAHGAFVERDPTAKTLRVIRAAHDAPSAAQPMHGQPEIQPARVVPPRA